MERPCWTKLQHVPLQEHEKGGDDGGSFGLL